MDGAEHGRTRMTGGLSGWTRRGLLAAGAPAILKAKPSSRPNILFAIADDHSYPHTGAMGGKGVKTPAIDRVAGEGVLFRQAYSLSPGCAPSRAGLLTGRFPWQLEEAGTHASLFPRKFAVYPDLLERNGYFAGLTGKGAGPCNFKDAGWTRNPAGPAFDRRRTDARSKGLSANDYAGNFEDFLAARPKDRPFCFWYGGHEPHRGYDQGSGVKAGKRLEDAAVPAFLPDTPEVRSDILDYYLEIEHFDRHLGRMLSLLEARGELENTLVVVTADNGMAFPGAKAAMYDYGIHLPLAIMWKAQCEGGRVSDDLISFADFAPTFLDVAGVPVPTEMVGRSLAPLLRSGRSGVIEKSRGRVFSGRERHSHARFDNLGYPSRAMREGDFLYIWNMKPGRWPAGDPEHFADIDAGPVKELMMLRRGEPRVAPLFEHSFGKRPEEQLFDVVKDPACMNNLALSSAHAGTRKSMRAALEKALTAHKDPRMLGEGDVWESYARYSPMRAELGGFAEQGKVNPKYLK
jgi:uncharacterized sulfatase